MIGEIQNLSKKTNFNNLIFYFKGNSGSKIFIACKGPTDFYENIKDGCGTLEKKQKKNKRIKSDINETLKRRYKSED